MLAAEAEGALDSVAEVGGSTLARTQGVRAVRVTARDDDSAGSVRWEAWPAVAVVSDLCVNQRI